MAQPAFEESRFVLATCNTCGAETLTHLTLGLDDELVRRCVRCDTPTTSALTEVSSDELEERGYAVVEARTCGNGGGCGAGCGSQDQTAIADGASGNRSTAK